MSAAIFTLRLETFQTTLVDKIFLSIKYSTAIDKRFCLLDKIDHLDNRVTNFFFKIVSQRSLPNRSPIWCSSGHRFGASAVFNTSE